MNDNTFYITLGSKLRAFRKAKHITLQDLSQQLNKSIATVSKYETGEIAVSLDVLTDICSILNINISTLFPDTPVSESADFQKFHTHFSDTLFLYWYNKEIDLIREAVIETKTSSAESILYLDSAHAEDYRQADYLYTGSVSCTDAGSEFLYTNIVPPFDKVFIRLPSFFKKKTSRTGMMSCITSYYQNVTVKVLAIDTRVSKPESLKDQLIYTAEEIKILKRTNFLTLY